MQGFIYLIQSTGCKPIADVESFTEDKLGYANLVEEVQTSGAKVVQVTGVKNAGKTVSVLIHGANNLILEEAERSIHDALCVVKRTLESGKVVAGGGAVEIAVGIHLEDFARTLVIKLFIQYYI